MSEEGIMDSPKQKNTDAPEPKLYELEDLWKKADDGEKSGKVMTFEEMNEAKVRRRWY
jgi:hypothetical protein